MFGNSGQNQINTLNQISKIFDLLRFCLVLLVFAKYFVTDCESFSLKYYKIGEITIIFTSAFIIRRLLITQVTHFSTVA